MLYSLELIFQRLAYQEAAADNYSPPKLKSLARSGPQKVHDDE